MGLKDGAKQQQRYFDDDLRRRKCASIALKYGGGGGWVRWDETIFQSEPFGQNMSDERGFMRIAKWTKKRGRTHGIGLQSKQYIRQYGTNAIISFITGIQERKTNMYAWPWKTPSNLFLTTQSPPNTQQYPCLGGRAPVWSANKAIVWPRKEDYFNLVMAIVVWPILAG